MSSPNPHAIDADTLSGMKPLRKVVYSLGSNLGDRLGNLQGAVDALRDTPDVIVVDVSPVYETEPIGGPKDSPKFLNLVVVAESTADVARARTCHRGRVRSPSRLRSLGPTYARCRPDHGRQQQERPGRSQIAASVGPRARVRPGAMARDRSQGRASGSGIGG